MFNSSDAYNEGYAAGFEFHVGTGCRYDNPYEYDTSEYADWELGFTQAGEDS